MKMMRGAGVFLSKESLRICPKRTELALYGVGGKNSSIRNKAVSGTAN
jgi:hypothetical protein